MAPGEVTVVASVVDLTAATPFVVLRPVDGDFSCAAEVHLTDDPVDTRLDTLIRFSSVVGCRVLTDTELDVDLDPYDWTLADPAGSVRRVSLDLDDEEDDIYRMVEDGPLGRSETGAPASRSSSTRSTPPARSQSAEVEPAGSDPEPHGEGSAPPAGHGR